MPEFYTFDGDAITNFGLVGIIGSVIITIAVFRNYWSSPYRK